jgi:hypothetical protein
VAILPRIVADRDLLSANSAMWVGETIADVVNYPIAGLFVVFLAGSLPLAFWFDAATYLASAVLLATIVVPPLARRAAGAARGRAGAEAGSGADDDRGAAIAAVEAAEPGTSVVADLKAGWAFLRRETVLLANTLQGTAGSSLSGRDRVQHRAGARDHQAPGDEYRATYAFMETAIGLGNLIGGFALGLVTTRVRKGG